MLIRVLSFIIFNVIAIHAIADDSIKSTHDKLLLQSKLNNRIASSKLGDIYSTESSEYYNLGAAEAFYKHATQNGHVPSYLSLAKLYINKKHNKFSYKNSEIYLNAFKSKKGTQYEGLLSYVNLKNDSKDYEAIYELAKTGELYQSPYSYLSLAKLYSQGLGVKKDWKLAYDYFKKANLMGLEPDIDFEKSYFDWLNPSYENVKLHGVHIEALEAALKETGANKLKSKHSSDTYHLYQFPEHPEGLLSITAVTNNDLLVIAMKFVFSFKADLMHSLRTHFDSKLPTSLSHSLSWDNKFLGVSLKKKGACLNDCDKQPSVIELNYKFHGIEESNKTIVTGIEF